MILAAQMQIECFQWFIAFGQEESSGSSAFAQVPVADAFEGRYRVFRSKSGTGAYKDVYDLLAWHISDSSAAHMVYLRFEPSFVNGGGYPLLFLTEYAQVLFGPLLYPNLAMNVSYVHNVAVSYMENSRIDSNRSVSRPMLFSV